MKRPLTFGVVLMVALMTTSGQARAQDSREMQQALSLAKKIPWKSMGSNVFERIRRSVALGPYVGLAGEARGGTDASVSFGLGLMRFSVPIVPDLEEISSILRDRFVELFLEKLDEARRGSPNLSGVRVKEIAAQVWKDILKAYAKGRKHRLLEKPGIRLLVEGTRFLDADTWQGRLTLGIGAGPFSLGLSLGGEFGGEIEDEPLFVGVELTKPLVFGSARSPVLDLLVRADRRFGDVEDALSFSFGARFLLDVI